MPIPLYLAMIAAEFSHCDPLPPKIAWMACHFSPYSTGLSNCPDHLPPDSLLILNDRTPVCGHDPEYIAHQMTQMAVQMHCAGILLDMQHPGEPQTTKIVGAICKQAPCPVAVSEPYCMEADCGVFLTPPLHIPLADYLKPWQHRQIWLEAAIETTVFVVTKSGCTQQPLPCPPQTFPHTAPGAYSRYHIALEERAIRFSFCRSKEDVEAIAREAENIHCLVGLYQQLK